LEIDDCFRFSKILYFSCNKKTSVGLKKFANKKIENGVVKTYTKIEDKFVDQFLTHDGETIEEAKERLKREQNNH
jgi:wobble nucleotide-excising tRNase